MPLEGRKRVVAAFRTATATAAAVGVLGLACSADTSVDLRLTAGKQSYSKAEPIRLTLVLSNPSEEDVLVVSHYATSGMRHFDNVQLELARREDGRRWTFSLSGPRKAVARVGCVLPPRGGTLQHEIDVADWLRLNEVDPGTGTFEVVAIYHVGAAERGMTEWARCDAVTALREPPTETGPLRTPWRGTVRSDPLTINITN